VIKKANVMALPSLALAFAALASSLAAASAGTTIEYQEVKVLAVADTNINKDCLPFEVRSHSGCCACGVAWCVLGHTHIGTRAKPGTLRGPAHPPRRQSWTRSSDGA